MRRMTVRDIDEERFFKIPKILNEDDYYKDLPVMARYLYGIMLDRFSLSKSRNWINANNEVYFIFKQKELAELLNVSESSIKRSIVHLKKHNLIESESTLTVNLYYISFPMPKTTGQIDPTSGNIYPTNSSNRPNNSETDISKTEKNKTEIYTSLSKHSDGHVFLITYLDLYKQKYGKEHMRVKKVDLYMVIEETRDFYEEVEGFSDESCYNVIVEYFDQLPKSNNGNILSFCTAKDRYLLNGEW